jgi:SAM-dependent methyltransferase
VLHFEASIEDAVRGFAQSLNAGARVLDAGAGEGQYAHWFQRQRYLGIDLGIGDAAWNYSGIDVVGDLSAQPFCSGAFEAAIHIVTLEHVPEPAKVIKEIGRVLSPGGALLLVAPHEWEEHQQPHDYFRYTRYGLEYLLQKGGFSEISIVPVGGYFRLLARRLLNGMQFFPAPLGWVWGLVVALPALVLPLLDGLDHRKSFTLGYICLARKER